MSRMLRWSVFVLLISAVPSWAQSPTMTMQIRPVEQLLADAQYMGRLLGEGTDLDRGMETLKKVLTLPGIDTKRHLGGYWSLEENPDPSAIVMMIPYQDEKKLLEQIATFGIKVGKEEDGSHVLSWERLPGDLYVRFHNRYAYATFKGKAAVAADKLVDPVRVIDKDAKALATMVARIEQIPKELRQGALQSMEQMEQFFQDDNLPPGMTKTQAAMMQQYVKFWTRVYRKMMFQSDTIEANFDIDRAKNVFSFDYRINARKGTEFARDLAELTKQKTRFGAFVRPDAVASGYLCFAYPPEFKKIADLIQNELMAEPLKKLVQDDAQAKAIADFMAQFHMGQSERVDLGFVVSKTKENKLSLAVGSNVNNGAAIDANYKKLIEKLHPDKAQDWVNVGKVGETSIHKYRVPRPKELESSDPATPLSKSLSSLHENPGYNAYRDKEAYFTAGASALEAMQAALRQPVEEKESGLYLQASVGRIVELLDVGGKDRQTAFADDPEAGKVSYALFTGQNIRFELKMNASVLRFLMLMRKRQAEL